METVKNRRSIRKYAGKPVDEELLRRLLEVSERTQTMGNMQLYSVVVTRSEEMKKRLAPAHFNQPMVTQAPVILTICADFNRTVKWAEQRKAHPGFARHQQEGAHGCRHADADGGHVAFDELHGVIDSHAGRDGAAGAVDIERDILVGILRLQEEHLCDHQ